MNKKSIEMSFRKNFPDSKALKKIFIKAEIRRLKKHLLDPATVAKCEESPEEKIHLIDFYKKNSKKKYDYFCKKMNKILQQAPDYQGRADLDVVRADMLFCYFAYGFPADEYVSYKLEGKDTSERRKYLSAIEKICYKHRMNDFTELVFSDKRNTYKRFKEHYKRDALAIYSKNDFSAFEDFIKKHSRFIVKQVDESCGRGIFFVNTNETEKSNLELFNEIFTTCNGKVLLEELIIQTEDMASFNTSSVNTVRCVTLNTKNGVKVFPFSILRTGRKGSLVDNGGSGGILSIIDDESGIVCTNGFNEWGQVFESHPDSGVTYKGFQIPEYQEMKDLCCKLAATIPALKYCSWDMSHTENGWVMVEGNPNGQLILQQTCANRGLKAEFEELVNEMDLLV